MAVEEKRTVDNHVIRKSESANILCQREEREIRKGPLPRSTKKLDLKKKIRKESGYRGGVNTTGIGVGKKQHTPFG